MRLAPPPCKILYSLDSYRSWGCRVLTDSYTASRPNSESSRLTHPPGIAQEIRLNPPALSPPPPQSECWCLRTADGNKQLRESKEKDLPLCTKRSPLPEGLSAKHTVSWAVRDRLFPLAKIDVSEALHGKEHNSERCSIWETLA